MSKFTTEVRYICENYAGLNDSVGYNDVDSVIEKSWAKVFSFDFPIFDEEYRPVLCKKILKHFYTREIGLETVGLWKLKLDTKMNEIMPYYNQRYKSELIKFNPMYDVDLTRKGNRVRADQNENNTDVVSDSTTNETAWRLHSDTPQGSLRNVENETYLTDATKNTDNTNTKNKGNSATKYKGDSDENYIEVVTGKQGSDSYSKRLIEFRKTFLNIDMEIITDLSDLFFLLWG